MRRSLLLVILLCTTVCASAQLLGKKYIKGAYYDTKGNRVPGLINWFAPAKAHKGADYISFKPEKLANESKISTSDMTAFVIDKDDDGMVDSFMVSKNLAFEDRPIVQVLSTKNHLKLYGSSISAYHAQAGGGVGYSAIETTYFFGPSADSLTVLDKQNFMRAMPEVMADKPEAVARIKNKKLRFSNMGDLLYFYKYDLMPPSNEPFRDPFEGLKE